MDHRPHGDGLVEGVDADELSDQLANEGKLLVDELLAKVPDVQVDVLPVWSLEGPPLLDLLHDGPGQDVPRPELHLGRDVLLEESLALLVDEVASLSPRGLGHQDAGAGEAR